MKIVYYNNYYIKYGCMRGLQIFEYWPTMKILFVNATSRNKYNYVPTNKRTCSK